MKQHPAIKKITFVPDRGAKTAKVDLDAIPKFLRLTAEQRKKDREISAARPNAPPPVPSTTVKFGQYTPSMLADPSTRKFIAELEAEKEQKREDRERRKVEEKEARPKKVNPLDGLIPLKDLLPDGVNLRHAKNAVEAAHLVHTKYHFLHNTVERVKKVLREYKVPEKRRGSPKTDIVAALLTRKGGCTTSDVLAATGWPAVSMPAMAKAAGLKLRKEKEPGVPTRYFGS